jgi:ABC-type molybdenum transport system ATPase subunit/photorepair protein PhrA
MNMFADAETLFEVVGQVIGAGSMCWESVDKAGVFQSELASSLVEDAIARIREIVESARSEEIAEVEKQRDRAEQIAEDRANLLNEKDAALLEAAGAIESWGAYAGEYFQTKWDLAGDIAAARKAANG